MKKSAGVLILAGWAAAGCAMSEESIDETGQVEQQAGRVCPDWGCGINSPAIADGWFHELNLDGVANLEGYSITNVKKGSTEYRLSVKYAQIVAFSAKLGGPTLHGEALEGLVITLKRVNSSTGSIVYYRLVIDDVAKTAQYIAQPPGATSIPTVETYRFRVENLLGHTIDYLCDNGDSSVPENGPVPMPRLTALVFEGDRINAKRKTVSPLLDNRWFNIGCAESALAKMQLYGRTQAAQSVGFSTTTAERQAFLKMLVADYCGTGQPFTVAGQPLLWIDDQRTMSLPSTGTRSVEARWRSSGPACLNTPRVDEHPTDAGMAAFPEGIEEAMRDANCTRPYPCWGVAPSTADHIISYNITDD